MNIITKSDIKKFIALIKVGLKKGHSKELTIYSDAERHHGTRIPKEYYVSLSLKFRIDPESVEKIVAEDFLDNEIEDLFND